MVAKRSLGRITGRCLAIADGREPGHVRRDVIVDRPIRFSNEPPWVIVFDPETRLIARILHQHRDIASILHRQ